MEFSVQIKTVLICTNLNKNIYFIRYSNKINKKGLKIFYKL